MESSLKGKVVLVTGGSSGLGRVLAVAFAGRGAAVAIASHGQRQDGDAVLREIQEVGGRGLFLPTDVSKREEVLRMVEGVAGKLGPPAVLVNNAGVAFKETFLEASEEAWNQTIDTNLKGTFLCSQAVAREMIRAGVQGGRIINVASHAGVKYIPGIGVHYHASKAGVILLTRVMAVELAPHGIRVNAIAPGPLETPMARATLDDPERRQALVGRIPVGRVGQPQDLVGLVLLLASEQADYITGAVIVADGGMIA